MFSRRAPDKTPANETRFLSDDDLEGRRLERVLGWSLMFVTLFAVVMLVYMVREPDPSGPLDRLLQERLGRSRPDVVRQPVE